MTRQDLLKISHDRDIIIYGAYKTAKSLFGILQRMGSEKQVKAFAVTNMSGNPTHVNGIPVLPVAELTEHRDNCMVLIATSERFIGEVVETLNRLFFKNYKTIGFLDCIQLMNEEVLDCWNSFDVRLSIAKNAYDYTRLDVFPGALPEQAGTEAAVTLPHCKLEVLTGFPFDSKSRKFLREIDFFETYESVCGTYRNLKQLPESVGAAKPYYEPPQIYMASSHRDNITLESFPLPSWVIPVQGGSALTEQRSGAICDNAGDNISKKNADYAELTVTYWAWKNSPPSMYKGLCHYRRHFVMDDADIRRMYANNVDTVLTTARLAFPDVKECFLEIPSIQNVIFNILEDTLTICAPDYLDTAQHFFEGNFYYPNNMVIAKAAVFDSYCEWMFGILFEMEARAAALGSTRGDRYLAYCAELLTSIYFIHHRKELKIAVTDYRFLG